MTAPQHNMGIRIIMQTALILSLSLASPFSLVSTDASQPETTSQPGSTDLCKDGPPCGGGTTTGGGQGGTCGGGVTDLIRCPTSTTVSGKVQPQYLILTVLYSPPGTKGGNSQSVVTYASGSTAGATVSSTDTFNQNYSISVGATIGIPMVASAGGAVAFGYSPEDSSSHAVDIRKTNSTTMSLKGSNVDGIDHNSDQIWLWLGSKVNVAIETATGATGLNSVTWELDNSTPPPVILQFVDVGWLKTPSTMPAGVMSLLAQYQITQDQFQDILVAADPITNGPIDSTRYFSLNTTFPYEPPLAPGDPVSTLSFTATTASTNTVTTSSKTSYSVGVTIDESLNLIDALKLSSKFDGKWTWTTQNSSASSNGTSDSISVTIGGPSYGYTGPTDIAVYYDAMYRTFAFAFISDQALSLKGNVKTTSGTAVPGKEVIATAKGAAFHTFTNSKGEYRIFGNIAGSVEVKVDDVIQTLGEAEGVTPGSQQSREVNIILP